MKNICWNITTRCNAECKFCNRMENIEELDFILNRKILLDLYNCGVKKITWTGGEALLYDRIDELIKLSHELGIKNHLITNGAFMTSDILEKLDGFLDYITISLDSCDKNVNKEIGRFEEQFEIVKNVVIMISNMKFKCKIKLNTIACAYTVDGIKDIIDFLNEFKIDRWKIFKFNDFRGNAKYNADSYHITYETFNYLKIDICNRLKSYKFNNDYVKFIDDTILEEEYILIRADGAIIITRDSKDEILGNLNFDSLTNIISQNAFYFISNKSESLKLI